MDKYMEEAKKIYHRKQQNEIERIADDLRKKDELENKKKIQDKCPHERTWSYNHGYHEKCRDCGKEV